jgi:hypothetical protein
MLRTNEIAVLCRATLKNPNASEEEKRRAKKALRRFEKTDTRRKDALDAVGEKPKREDFENDDTYRDALRDFRTSLDKHCIARDAYSILDSPETSPRVRQRARERLAAIGILDEAPVAIEAAEPQQRVKPSSGATPRGQLSDTEFAEERRRERQFLAEVAELAAELQKGKTHEQP